MKTAKNSNLLVTSNPHIVDSMNTTKIMSLVVIALLPSLIASVVIFGARALILAAVCIVASMFFEWAYEKLAKKPSTVGDLSAVVTGLLIAMNVPVTRPYWMLSAASLLSSSLSSSSEVSDRTLQTLLSQQE